MHTRHLPFIALSLALLLVSCEKKPESELVIYTYDSFVAEWGAAPGLAALFEKETGIKPTFVSKGDGGQLLQAVLLEKGKPGADIVLGLDNNSLAKAIDSGLFKAYKPKGLEAIPAEIRLDKGNRLIPFDYGHFAIIWDSKTLPDPPSSLEDLTKPEYAKKLIIMDPRTSTPGLGFLAWTKAVYGDAWKDYWKRLAPSILAMTPSWDTGYGLFTSGEAPLVLSYATSPAYHLENDKTDRYRALEFSNGHTVQVEFAGVLKDARHPVNAERFMDFLVSAAAQEVIPLTQYMYPANPEARLPESFSLALKPAKTLGNVILAGDEAAQAAEILATR